MAENIYVKIHNSGIVAICDEELLGKELKQGKLRFNVNENFYKGEKKTEEEAKKIMKEANSLNIVGKRSVKIALKLGLINNDSIIVIGGVPHAQVISF